MRRKRPSKYPKFIHLGSNITEDGRRKNKYNMHMDSTGEKSTGLSWYLKKGAQIRKFKKSHNQETKRKLRGETL